VVADDCALPRTKGITGARGVAGTVLVHKIAGAAAAAGMGLAQVRDVARRACARMGTLGFALDSVTVPGAIAKNDRLDESTIEIGLGIHGEAGTKNQGRLSSRPSRRYQIDCTRVSKSVLPKRSLVFSPLNRFETVSADYGE
jgi:dihydroxyacetone kinase